MICLWYFHRDCLSTQVVHRSCLLNRRLGKLQLQRAADRSAHNRHGRADLQDAANNFLFRIALGELICKVLQTTFCSGMIQLKGAQGLPYKRQLLPVEQVDVLAHAVPDASKLQGDVASSHYNNGALWQVSQGQGLIGGDCMLL